MRRAPPRRRRGSRPRCRPRPSARGRVAGVEGRAGRAERSPAAFRGCDRAGAFPGPLGRGLAAGVGELRAPHGALLADEARDAGELLDVLVLPDAEVLRRDAALGGHRDRLGEHQRRAADRAAAEVHQVPVARKAVVRRVLAPSEGLQATRLRISRSRRRMGVNSRLIGGDAPASGWTVRLCRDVRPTARCFTDGHRAARLDGDRGAVRGRVPSSPRNAQRK